MRSQILLTLQPVDGALVRVLSLVERRGFSIRSLRANRSEGEIEVGLEVHAEDRSVENLIRQVGKLVDVTTVRLPDADSREPAN